MHPAWYNASMIKAVIFDMDGLLIDSEPLWKEAEVAVFIGVGVPLSYEMTDQTMGLRTDEVVAYWHQRYPWTGRSPESVGAEIDGGALQLIKEKAEPKAGVEEAIGVCESMGLPMAIASSSSMAIINAVVEKLGVGHKFTVIHSAEFEAYGKPHPAVYLSAADKLGVNPGSCLAFEDSANGVLSAKAAKMHCIAVPDPELRHDKRFGIADVVVDSLLNITPEIIQSL